MQSSGPTAGVAWASQTHVACVVGDDGGVIDQFTFPHDGMGLKEMVRRFRAAGVEQVAIDAVMARVEVLLDAALAVFGDKSPDHVVAWRYGSACKMTGSTPMCSRTPCGPTGTGGACCARIMTTPVRCGRRVGPVKIWWRRGCRC